MYTDNSAHTFQAKHLTLKAYTEMLDSRPIYCGDVVPCDAMEKKLLLPTRRHMPGEGGPWLIGGQALAGEIGSDTAHRHFQDNTHLRVSKERLSLLKKGQDIIWSYRPEPPQHKGRHDRTDVYSLSISHKEKNLIERHLCNQEYIAPDGLIAYNRDELHALIHKLPETHPRRFLVELYDLIFDSSGESR